MSTRHTSGAQIHMQTKIRKEKEGDGMAIQNDEKRIVNKASKTTDRQQRNKGPVTRCMIDRHPLMTSLLGPFVPRLKVGQNWAVSAQCSTHFLHSQATRALLQ